MNILKKFIFLGAITLASAGANAEFVKGDWKNIGDNLSVVDLDTGIEWLSVSQTDNWSIAAVQSNLSTTFSGWRLPTPIEVDTMLLNLAGISDVFNNGHEYDTQAETIVNALGSNYQSSNYINLNAMYFNQDSINGTYTSIISTSVQYSSRYGSTIRKHSNHSDDPNYSHSTWGVFLVSDGGATISSISNPTINAMNANSPANLAASVPEPESVAIMGLSLLAFGLSRRKQLKAKSF